MRGDAETGLEHGGCEGLKISGSHKTPRARAEGVVEAGDRFGNQDHEGGCGNPGWSEEKTSLKKSALGYSYIYIRKQGFGQQVTQS